ncbi:MAG: trigger factor [Dissulfurispiraceae bacterium]|nr:trigger factor [Dissulfurispiraceae bacterium]
MIKSVDDISATMKKLQIEIPSDEVEERIQAGLKEAQKQARIPGFRPGKAPMNMIEKKYLNDVEIDVMDKIVPEYYLKSLKEADLVPVASPIVEESFDYKRHEPISFTVRVEIRPKIDNLQYENIKVTDVPVEVKDEDVDAVIKTFLEERAVFEIIEEPAGSEDLVIFDAKVKDDGTEHKDLAIKINTSLYPKNFTDAFIGKKSGDSFECEADFSKESPLEFAGKKLNFEVSVKEVKRHNIPEFNDELVKDLNFESTDELKAKVRENLLVAKNREADLQKQREIIKALADTHDFEVPASLLYAELKGIVSQVKALNKDERTEDELKEEYRQKAIESVKATLLIDIIGEKENVTVSPEDMEAEVIRMAQKYMVPPDTIAKHYMDKDGSFDLLRKTVFEKKVLNLLLSKATVEKGE